MSAVSGKVGALYASKRNCLLFNAFTETLTVSDPSGGELDFVAANSFSIEFWWKATSSVTDTANIIAKFATSTGYQFGTDTDKGEFIIGDGTNTPTITGTTDICDGVWHHIICVRDVTNDEIRLYVDGARDNTAVTDSTTATLANAADLIVTGIASDVFRLGMLRIYNSAVGDADAIRLANGAYVSDLKTYEVGSWMLFEGTGTTAVDQNGNGNDATIADASWDTETYDSASDEDHFAGGASFNLTYPNVDNENFTITVDGTALTTDEYTLTPRGSVILNTAPAATSVVSYRYYSMVLECGGYFNWSADVPVDEAEITTFTSGQWKEFMSILSDWSGSAEAYWINYGHAFDTGQKLIFRLYYDEAAAKFFDGWGLIMGVSITSPVETVVTKSVSFKGTGQFGSESTPTVPTPSASPSASASTSVSSSPSSSPSASVSASVSASPSASPSAS